MSSFPWGEMDVLKKLSIDHFLSLNRFNQTESILLGEAMAL